MFLEYDPAKSESNKDKHGIDFEAAKAIWADERRLEVAADSRGELRWGIICRIQSRVWVAFFTLRDGRIRLISVRRARQEEIQCYEQDHD